MPPKGDRVGNKEIRLSAPLSEMQTVNKSDSMLVYEGLLARRHSVLPRLPYIIQFD